ncbi:hypothetical protein TWF102_009352 [Orbilia oligospora]|uniref:Uncharacterized protein n=1 Tax=Orbilia oligospora TaxID=2813651 RepID=A0A7C8NXQ6_ORBOL|nr:hypothetical protein TWF103_004254 [Orbilia oligospora]KAF3090394.1 hypothetical protein TWF102_009352 [Orbilia oligospora]KAF3096582.1 hypothetical protein TWF706_007636 [Orbilia oligospora]KAF3139498.1 hypothetical protein TWF703_003687 [Orbilia oligospora]KAF3141054.1 hypothetical protein TWF594_006096 [Orbilia oligospora]
MVMSSDLARIPQKQEREACLQKITVAGMSPLVKPEEIEYPMMAPNAKYYIPSIKDAEGIQLLSAAAFSYPPTYLRATTSPQSIVHMAPGRGSPRRQPIKAAKRTPRDHRPMYSQEEADAILYLRDSVGLPWKKVVELWNLLYDARTGKRWGPRTISGLQSHYYRMLGIDKSHGRRSSAPNPDIGLLKATNRRYWWVYSDRPDILTGVVRAPEQLKILQKQNIRRLRREAQREGRRQRKLTRRSIVEHPKETMVPHLSKVMQAALEEPKCMEVEENCANDSDSDSSTGDSFDQNSISDVDGYDTSSIAPPPSSHTSTPTSPFEGFDFEAKASRRLSEDLKNQSNILPPFKSLWGLADRGNKRDTNIIQWQDRVETLQRPVREKTGVTPFRPTNKNPMAVASLLI